MSTARGGTARPHGLVEGLRLDQPTFHELYAAMPPGTRAELIRGVVHMPSPVGRAHGRAHVPAVVWLSYYAEATPGVEVLDNATTILGFKSEPQPDALLRILPDCGGRTEDKGAYIKGAPELIVEVSRGTRYIDLGPKLNDYEDAGVSEYVVRALEPDEVLWHARDAGRLAQFPTDPDGVHRSEVFPGLWLDPQALIAGDTRRLREVIDQGAATAGHRDFVARLAAARPSP